MTHDIRRWHCHPHPALRNSGDTVKEHCRRLAVLHFDYCRFTGEFIDDSVAFYLEHHDDPEFVMGDWPATLARKYWVARWAKRILEWQIKREMGLRWPLTRRQKAKAGLFDTLDAVLLAKRELTKAGDVAYFNDHFCADIHLCGDKAAKLGRAAEEWLVRQLRK